MNLLKGSLFLKFAALIMAIATYYFVHAEIRQSEQKAPDPSYELLKITAKTLPVNVRLATMPPEGYRLSAAEQVFANPSHVVVIGPQALLEKGGSVETALVDVSESTKTTMRHIPLESVAGVHLAGDPYTVEVTVPVEKIPEPEPAGPAESPAGPTN